MGIFRKFRKDETIELINHIFIEDEIFPIYMKEGDFLKVIENGAIPIGIKFPPFCLTDEDTKSYVVSEHGLREEPKYIVKKRRCQDHGYFPLLTILYNGKRIEAPGEKNKKCPCCILEEEEYKDSQKENRG
jgi:hypothetical protein